MFLAKKFVDQLGSNYHMEAQIIPMNNNGFAIAIKESADKVFDMLFGLKYSKFMYMTQNHAGCDKPVYDKRPVFKHSNGYAILVADDDLATKMNIIDHSLREYYYTHSMIK